MLGIEAELPALCEVAQRLWNAEPQCGDGERAGIMVELSRLDIELQRLQIRALCDELDGPEVDTLVECADRLESLLRWWPSEARVRP
jgi:hypothetical protein